MIMIFGTLVLKDDFSKVFFIFLNFSYDINIWSGAIHISETIYHMIVIYGTLV